MKNNLQNRERNLRMATNSCISSARRFALLIVGLGSAALLMGWSENTRQQRFYLFAHIEKVLTAQQAISKGDWSTSDSTYKWRLLQILEKDSNAAAILQAEKGVPKLEVHFREGTTRTRGDPLNECPATILTFPPEGKAVEIAVNQGGKQDAIWPVEPQKIFLIAFDETCSKLPEPYTGPAVIAQIALPRGEAIALPSKILGDLRVIAPPVKLIRRGVTPGAIEATEDTARDLNDALYLEDVKALVLARAKVETGNTYNDVNKALDDLLAARDLQPEFQGMPVPPQIAVLVLSIIFLSTAFSLWHRIRRIPPHLLHPDEPWIMLRPNGIVEITVVFIWSAILLVAVAPIGWAVYLYTPEAVVFTKNIARGVTIGSVVVIGIAEIVLIACLGHLLQINTGSGWIGWWKRIGCWFSLIWVGAIRGSASAQTSGRRRPRR